MTDVFEVNFLVRFFFMSLNLFASKSKSSFGQSLVFKPLFTFIFHICWWFLIVRFQKFLLKIPSNEPSLAWS
jgi:hypothetical protein